MSPGEAERQVVVFSVLGEPFALPIARLPAAAKRELGEEIAAVDDRLILLVDPERVALAAGLTAPARRARRRVDPGSRGSKATPSDPRR
jgi:hypothetical protein